jgi:hypothetical protein
MRCQLRYVAPRPSQIAPFSVPVLYAPRTEGARSASGAGRQFHARGAGQVHLPGQIIAGYASRQLKAEALVIRIDPRVAKPNPRGCGGSAPRNARQAHSRPHVCQGSTKVRSNNQPSPTVPRTRQVGPRRVPGLSLRGERFEGHGSPASPFPRRPEKCLPAVARHAARYAASTKDSGTRPADCRPVLSCRPSAEPGASVRRPSTRCTSRRAVLAWQQCDAEGTHGSS